MFSKMAEWGLVKYFGSLINPEALGRRLGKIAELYETNSFMRVAKRLFFWAVFIIIIATIIDLAFYWLRPEQKDRLEHMKEKFVEYKRRFLNKTRTRGRQSKR